MKDCWWNFINPNMKLRLLLIIIFLVLITIGNALGIYEGIIIQDKTKIINSFAAMLVYAIPAYGLFKLKSWARLLEICLSVLLVLLGCIVSFIENIILGIMIIIPHGLIALYLISNECKELFDVQTKKQAS